MIEVGKKLKCHTTLTIDDDYGVDFRKGKYYTPNAIEEDQIWFTTENGSDTYLTEEELPKTFVIK